MIVVERQSKGEVSLFELADKETSRKWNRLAVLNQTRWLHYNMGQCTTAEAQIQKPRMPLKPGEADDIPTREAPVCTRHVPAEEARAGRLLGEAWRSAD